MAIFNSYVSLPEGISFFWWCIPVSPTGSVQLPQPTTGPSGRARARGKGRWSGSCGRDVVLLYYYIYYIYYVLLCFIIIMYHSSMYFFLLFSWYLFSFLTFNWVRGWFPACATLAQRKLVEDATCVSMWRMIHAINICFSMSTGMSLEMHHHVSFWISQRPRFKAMLMEKWHLTQRIYSKDILFSIAQNGKYHAQENVRCPTKDQYLYIYTNTCIDQLIKLISRKHAKCWLTSGSLHFTLGSYMRSF